MQLYPKLILDALAKVRYPGNGKNLVANGMIEDDIRIDGNKVSFSIIFEKPNDPFIRSVVKAAETAILTFVSPDVEIKGNIAVKAKQIARPNPENPLPGVKNIIAVSSGKGGVGKSTIASNLAVALARLGYKVGLLDADIFGPSAPTMFDIEDTDVYTENIGGRDLILPVERYGVKILSIGFFVRKNDAVLWRGGMASNALKQLITDAAWGDLDYFVLDLPPGTSDIHLTLVQTLAITGAIVVTTPQEVALADARKGISMFTGDKVNVPMLVHPGRTAREQILPLRQRRRQTAGRGGRSTSAGTDSHRAEHLRERRLGSPRSPRRLGHRTGFQTAGRGCGQSYRRAQRHPPLDPTGRGPQVTTIRHRIPPIRREPRQTNFAAALALFLRSCLTIPHQPANGQWWRDRAHARRHAPG